MDPSPPTPEREFRVQPALDGQRLDKGLAALVPELSRARLREIVEDGRVRLDGEVVTRPAHRLAAGQRLAVVLVPRDRTRPGRPDGREFGVLHEDADLAVIDKPPGMVAHASSTVQGGTVSELAVRRFGPLPSPQGADRPGIVHRLDADTSGAMVLARSERACAELLRQFREREVEKRYLALVHGDPRFDSEWIEAPIARSERSHDRMAVAPEGEGRPAETFYRVLERFGDLALLACEPKTGRTHQIRVHLASIGHPVAGDALYRGRRKLQLPAGAPNPGRHALHADRLEFSHPASGERVAFEAPLAPDLAALVAWLRARQAE